MSRRLRWLWSLLGPFKGLTQRPLLKSNFSLNEAAKGQDLYEGAKD